MLNFPRFRSETQGNSASPLQPLQRDPSILKISTQTDIPDGHSALTLLEIILVSLKTANLAMLVLRERTSSPRILVFSAKTDLLHDFSDPNLLQIISDSSNTLDWMASILRGRSLAPQSTFQALFPATRSSNSTKMRDRPAKSVYMDPCRSVGLDKAPQQLAVCEPRYCIFGESALRLGMMSEK